jgi:hypothetical protein
MFTKRQYLFTKPAGLPRIPKNRIIDSHHRRSWNPHCCIRYGSDRPVSKTFAHGNINLFLGPTQLPTEWGQSFFPRGNTGREVNHSPLSNIKVKNECS